MVIRKRSVTISGHGTSISLEAEFLDCLMACAGREDLPLAALVARIDRQRPRDTSLSSALRLHVLAEARAGNLPVNSPAVED